MAPRTLDRLTNIVVTRTKAPGWYADGGGLYLRIRDDGSRRWFFVYFLAGKRTEMGLGNAADLSLSDARLERTKWRKAVKDGKNPLAERRRERAEAAAGDAPTFATWAKEIAPAVAPRAPKAHAAWLRMMTEWVGPLKAKPVNEVRTEDVLAALKPYWKSRPESGRRMRLRIEAVLDAAKAKGLIADPWANPARWKGHLQHLLEKPAVAVRHHPALPYADAPAFMATLRERENMGAHALAFTILTAARTSETIHATWGEMDLAAKVWTVPAQRMKGGREHRVPLSDAALAVLALVKDPNGVKPTSWVFPSFFRKGRPLSTAAMERVLDDMGLRRKVTVHGFRSTFRDWAGDVTNFDRATVEAALAHAVGDATEAAYRRGDALLKRRKLMEAWAGFLAAKAGSNVRPLVRPG